MFKFSSRIDLYCLFILKQFYTAIKLSMLNKDLFEGVNILETTPRKINGKHNSGFLEGSGK